MAETKPAKMCPLFSLGSEMYEECRRDCAWFIEMSGECCLVRVYRALDFFTQVVQFSDPDLPAAITVRRMVK